MKATVGLRELKSRLNEVLRRVAAGERLVVLDDGRPVAIITPFQPGNDDEAIWALVREGRAAWGGGKPLGAQRPVRLKGRPIHETVLEDRR